MNNTMSLAFDQQSSDVDTSILSPFSMYQAVSWPRHLLPDKFGYIPRIFFLIKLANISNLMWIFNIKSTNEGEMNCKILPFDN